MKTELLVYLKCTSSSHSVPVPYDNIKVIDVESRENMNRKIMWLIIKFFFRDVPSRRIEMTAWCDGCCREVPQEITDIKL